MTQPLPNDEHLSAYLDNELSPEERARVEQRLATDSEYAATLDGLRGMRERLRALPKGSIDVRQSVMERVSEQSRVVSGGRQSNWQAAAWAIASLAALLMLGLFLYLPDESTEVAVVQNEVAHAGKAPVLNQKLQDKLADESEADADAGSLLDAQLPASEVADTPEFAAPAITSWSAPKNQEADEAAEAMLPEPLAPAAAAQSLKVAERSQEDESQLSESTSLRSRSAPIAVAGAVPTRSSRAKSSATGESVDEDASAERLDRAEKQAASMSSLDKLTLEGILTGKGLLKRLDNRPDRMWSVYPTPDQSDERLTVARFRRALEEAGCDYREVKPLPPLSQSGNEAKRLAKGKQGVDFIIVAAPEQLLKLRKLAKQFASTSRVDITMRSTRGSMSQEDWDGSRLPRENGLDPPGKQRSYLFSVWPEKEPPATP